MAIFNSYVKLPEGIRINSGSRPNLQSKCYVVKAENKKRGQLLFFFTSKKHQKTTWAHDQQDLSRVLFMWIKHESARIQQQFHFVRTAMGRSATAWGDWDILGMAGARRPTTSMDFPMKTSIF